MVEDMHGFRAVFKYGGDESGREIGGDILDVELLSSDSFPTSGQSIGRLALTHMENPTALEVNDNGLVQMGMTALGTAFRSSFTFDMLR